jgi:hypothetical protein
MALRADGRVIAWGQSDYGELEVIQAPEGCRYVDIDAGPIHALARYEGCPTCEPPFCAGDAITVACPCSNNGGARRGCDNSASTNGAHLTVRGSVDPDRVELGLSETLPSSLCFFLQGRSVLASPTAFGDGVRCIGGKLARLAAVATNAGTARYPSVGDPSISSRSAVLGDLIRPGTFRYYQAIYRDPDPGFCTPATFNASNAVMVRW